MKDFGLYLVVTNPVAGYAKCTEAAVFVAKPLECAHKPCDLRCPRRDTPPGVSVVYRN